MTQHEFHHHDEEAEDDEDDGVFEADTIKIGFCPDCGTAVLVLGDYENDVAVAHMSEPTIDNIIRDLQSIKARLNN